MDPFYALPSRLAGTFVLVCLSWFGLQGGHAQTPYVAAPEPPIAVQAGEVTSLPVLECADDEQRSEHDGAQRRSFERFEEAVRAQINRDRFQVYRGERPAEAVWSLPVVVHVYHRGEDVGDGFNLSYPQLNSALEALNADFANGESVDTGIRFKWARRDAADVPTTGIVRHLFTDETLDRAHEWMAEVAWDPERYVNLFVLPDLGRMGLKGQTIGASLESAPLGIAIASRAFGTHGWVDAWTSSNRTLTHQMGHYLGLRHVYATGGEGDCSRTGDGVCDTAPTGRHTACEPVNADEDVHNHMDGTPGICRTHFTPGQKERMRAVLQATRPALIERSATEPIAPLDGAITGVRVRDLACSSEGTPWVELANVGTAVIDSAIVRIRLNSHDAYPVFWRGRLAAGERVRIEGPKMAIGYGPYALSVELELPVANGRNRVDASSPFQELEGYLANNAWVASGENLPGNRLALALAPDAFGDEISWVLTDQNGTEWAHSAPYPLGKAGIPVEQATCVPAGCYRLELSDAGGNGLGQGHGTWYELRSGNGDVLASGTGDYGAGTRTSFCVAALEIPTCMDANQNGVCDDLESRGCTDELGCNYDPKATFLSDCEFPDFGRDCSGECLGDRDGDGICDQLEWQGCLDASACNYDDRATDEGPCEYGNCNESAAGLGEALDGKNEIKLYPNPSMEQPPVWTVEGFTRDGMRARLYSPNGVLVWETVTERESDGRHRLRTNTWIASGAYILELSAADYEHPVAPSVVHVRVR